MKWINMGFSSMSLFVHLLQNKHINNNIDKVMPWIVIDKGTALFSC